MASDTTMIPASERVASWPEQLFRWLSQRSPVPYGLIVLLSFGAVFLGAQSFVCVEGDDATSFAYHAMGRQAAVQPPYAVYNGMMDFLLSWLPASEPIVRVTGLVVSSLAAAALVLLALQLVFAWAPNIPRSARAWIAVISLLAVPEVFFLSLVYTPNAVAIAFLLGAHLAVRRAVRGASKPSLPWALGSLALFGFGVACRWETAAYGLVVVVDLWLGTRPRGENAPLRNRFVFGFIWGTLALVSTYLFIGLSGYGFTDLRDWFVMSRQASAGYFDSALTKLSFFGRYQSFFTPICLLLALTGLISFLRQPAQLVRCLIGFLPMVPIFYRGAPKLLYPALPGLLLCVAEGFRVIWYAPLNNRIVTSLRAVLLVVAVGPWLIGVKVHSQDTQWGPGFEVRRPAGSDASTSILQDDATRTIGIAGFRPAWADGFAIATPEGPRPVGGYAAVLFGGRWRALVNSLDKERADLVRNAIQTGAPILQDDGNALIMVHLLGHGFVTTESRKNFVDGFNRRQFINPQGQTVVVIQLQERPSLFQPNQVQTLMANLGGEKALFYSHYSSSLKKLFRLAPQAAQATGPLSAVLDLTQLRDLLQARENSK
jgi:hypothetical protein